MFFRWESKGEFMQNKGIVEFCRGRRGVNSLYSKKFNPLSNSKNFGFTLAEVLITLGIIGIIAALTLPTLLNNVQDKILEAQVKKAKSVVVNGYKLMMAHDEIFKVENIPFLTKCNSMDDIECLSKEHKEAFQILTDSADGLSADIMPEQYAISEKNLPSPFKWTDTKYMYGTDDGMVFGIIPNDTLTGFDVIVDVNAKSNPNTATKDLRKFRFSGDGGQLYDVSEELTKVTECSFENIAGCTTEEECHSIEAPPTDLGHWEISWYDGACHADYII